MVTLLKNFIKDIIQYAKHLSLRTACQNRELFFDSKAKFNGCLDHFIFGKGCSVGSFSIIDITNDPTAATNEARIELGDYVYIGEGCNLRAAGSQIRIGSHTMVANSAIIVGSNHKISLETPIRLQPWELEGAGVEIGEDCWIGAGAIVLPGSSIGDGSVVAAGAVTRGHVPSGSIVGGVPARFIRMRV